MSDEQLPVDQRDQQPVFTPDAPGSSQTLRFPSKPLEARSRQEEILAALHARLFEELCEYAAELVSRDDAEDIVQRAFVEIWNRYLSDPDRHPSASLDALLLRIVRFRVLDYRRNRKTQRANLANYVAKLTRQMPRWMRADARLESDAFNAAIDAAKKEMSQRARELHAMHYEAGLSVPRIAELTGAGRETIKTLLQRANTTMRERLDRAGYGPSRRLDSGKERGLGGLDS